MSAHDTDEPDGFAEPASLAVYLARVDCGIEEAERLLDEQERKVRQAVLSGRNAEHDTFDLHKMQLILALLREGRARMLGRAPSGDGASGLPAPQQPAR
jgi:hypothetical protein